MCKKYQIETVNDFLKIPEDKIDKCLDELKDVLKTTNNLYKLGKIISDYKEKEPISLNKFIWKDDGKVDKNCKIHIV